MTEIPRLHILKENPLVAGSRLTHFGETAPLFTPNGDLFVRENKQRIEVAPSEWTLAISGLVKQPTIIDIKTLKSLGDEITQNVVKQCAGDNRNTLTKPWEGEPWGAEAYGAYQATGIRLKAVFDAVQPQGEYLIFSGHDGYQRRMTRKEISDPQLMLCYEMNGEDLPPVHGGPVSLVAPGWYGMQWVKNLASIDVQNEPGEVFYNDQKYYKINPLTGEKEPLTAMKVVSRVVNLQEGDRVPKGSHSIEGRAWVGSLPQLKDVKTDTVIEKVEVSLDGGKKWDEAEITSDIVPNMWSSWSYNWEAKKGHSIIMSRAHDTDGNVQPLYAPQNDLGYENNAIQQITVFVID